MMNNAVSGRSMENVRKKRYIKLVRTEKRNYLVSEPNYYTTKIFTETFLAIEMKKSKIYMDKPVYLELSIQKLSKIVMHEFCYDYVKPKYGKKQNCYIWIEKASLDTDSASFKSKQKITYQTENDETKDAQNNGIIKVFKKFFDKSRNAIN